MKRGTRQPSEESPPTGPRTLWAVTVAVATAIPLIHGSDVLAQADPADSGAATPAEGEQQPAAEMRFRKASQLSGAEQMTQANQYMSRMTEQLAKVNKLAERARIEKDIIKLNCVNDKLIQIKGNISVAEQGQAAMKAADARADEPTRNHEFAKLTITYQKVIVLGQEAETCIGEEIAYVGATRVDVSVDPDVVQEDAIQPSGGVPASPTGILGAVASPTN